jgi:DNA-binding SARP family transcriptional activator
MPSVLTEGPLPTATRQGFVPTFGVLGPLRIRQDGEEVMLPSSKPTVLLGALLLNANEVVSQEFLRSALWGEEPPANASSAIHVAVLRLRKLLGKHGLGSGPDGGIETSPGGYRITVDAQSLDLLAFRDLVTRAGRTPSPAAELTLMRSALELWEGDPVLNLTSPALRAGVAASLVEERIRILARCHDIELSRGNCAVIVPELRQLSSEFPSNERLAAQLMEALYRTGRQGEALSAYQQTRRHLREHFGVDPVPELQQLHMAIVRGERLAGAGPTVAPARSTAGPGNELPVGVADFTGRAGEIEEIESILGRGERRILVICGLPGTGKTALAVHLAHRLAHRFPDRPQFLRSARHDHFAGGTPGPGSLVILDDVRQLDQAQPVVDAGTSGTVIITSRHSLAGLALSHGAALYRIGSWQRADSVAFLESALGTERASLPLDRLAEACDDHPMALRLAATRIALRPHQDITEALAHRAVVRPPGDYLANALNDYVSSMLPAALTALRALAATETGSLSAADSAALLGQPELDVRDVFDCLVESCAVEHLADDRYRVPRILRDHLNHDPARSSR